MSAAKVHFQATVGAAIVAMREKRGLRQGDLARMAKLTQPTVYKAEDGGGVTLYDLARIAEALDCTLDDLVPTEATTLPRATDAAAE